MNQTLGYASAGQAQPAQGIRSRLQEARGFLIGCAQEMERIRGIRMGVAPPPPTMQGAPTPGIPGPMPLEQLATDFREQLAVLEKELTELRMQLE